MTRTEAAWRLEEIADEIYDKLDEMEDIFKGGSPERTRKGYGGPLDGTSMELSLTAKDG